MHSYLLNIPSTNTVEIKEEISRLSNTSQGKKVLFHHPDVIQLNETSTQNLQTNLAIKINDIRLLKKRLTQQPLQLATQIAIIWNAHSLTIPSQNALLKLLEEPGDNINIFLITQSLNQLLPTILSRCQIIQKTSNNGPNNNGYVRVNEINQLDQITPIQRLTVVEKYTKDRQAAQSWLKKVILTLRKQLGAQERYSGKDQNSSVITNYQLPITITSAILKNAQIAYNDVSANCNIKLAIDNFVLKWDKPLDEMANND